MRDGTSLDGVENLVWKRADGTVATNPLTFVPADLMLSSVFKYARLADFLPYLEWLRYPSTMLLNSPWLSAGLRGLRRIAVGVRDRRGPAAARTAVAGQARGRCPPDLLVLSCADLHGPRRR